MSPVVFARGHALAAAAALGCHGYRSGKSSLRLLRLYRYLSSAGTGQQPQQEEQKQAPPPREQPQKSIIFSERPTTQSYATMTPAQKVVEGTKDAAYGLVVLAGVLVTGGLFYALWRDAFSSQSPAALQSLAAKRCLADAQVQSALGEPIKSHGEGSSRRSRSLVHADESVDAAGVQLTTVKFHLVGQYNRADVFVQGYLTESKKWHIKLLVLELQQYPKKVIILEREDDKPKVPDALVPLPGRA